MNLLHFEQHINKTILDRGYSYYLEGNIVEAYEQERNEYIFIIEGSEDYEVFVEIDDSREIQCSTCDCPYDFGPICKHEVAAYFKLIEMLNEHGESLKHRKSQPKIKEVLVNLSKEELVDILINMANEDAVLKQSLIFKYAKGDDQDELEKCKALMNKIKNRYIARDGFISYREVSDFVGELDDIFEKARNHENPLMGLEIALFLLIEAMNAFQYADDSDGDIGGLVTVTLELIEEIVIESNELGIPQRERAFEKLMAHVDSGVFSGWEEFKINLLYICTEFADVVELRARLKVKIESMLELSTDDRYTEYNNEGMLQILFTLIESYGTREEAEQFIIDHITYTSFREQLINQCFQERNYHKVIELTKDGEMQDAQYPGLVSKWKQLRYVAYKEQSLKKEQEQLAKELLFEGDFHYYEDLKELSIEDKAVFYDKLKEELRNDNGWGSKNIFLKLIEEENDVEEIMQYVRKNITRIEYYADRLIESFRDEVIDLYKDYINKEAKASSYRNAYRNVCNKLKKYKTLAGKEKQEELINELSLTYKRRPAFLDELEKIK
ncbi:hypothetical protein [Bacillus sp. FJAT-50079]|uniref:SWIM zinc finger family protein n=1 Tax=Bacillus sp. FJAT-50079 TaxID=2833577 RepID=UPI001BC97A1F|nr:hypothetical protein [Bacillus sp. FJAT-50079]MBS4209471.1 hypothetical protein [Bacillus sp. FJAT-50079]